VVLFLFHDGSLRAPDGFEADVDFAAFYWTLMGGGFG
jgi:hypothetical protein